MRVLCDFHHSSLLRSLVLLFEGRLGMDLYRPIGMEWFDSGYWAINNQRDTAAQFLEYDSQPLDATPGLNDIIGSEPDGVCRVYDPGMQTRHRACTLDYFKNNKFDYVIASIPAHVPIFERLIAEFQPGAKLIIQMGNNWNLDRYSGYNILASLAPQPVQAGCNTLFYHQEFDLDIFCDTPISGARLVYSFINVIQNTGVGWEDYKALKRAMERTGWDFKAFGGQCPDGNMTGVQELASKMREASFIFHVKPGGDGYGHIIHNAYAVGRPVITRSSHYRGQLAEQLLVPGTFIDLDRYSIDEVRMIIQNLVIDQDALVNIGKMAANRFDDVVDFKRDAEEVALWLATL